MITLIIIGEYIMCLTIIWNVISIVLRIIKDICILTITVIIASCRIIIIGVIRIVGVVVAKDVIRWLITIILIFLGIVIE